MEEENMSHGGFAPGPEGLKGVRAVSVPEEKKPEKPIDRSVRISKKQIAAFYKKYCKEVLCKKPKNPKKYARTQRRASKYIAFLKREKNRKFYKTYLNLKKKDPELTYANYKTEYANKD